MTHQAEPDRSLCVCVCVCVCVCAGIRTYIVVNQVHVHTLSFPTYSFKRNIQKPYVYVHVHPTSVTYLYSGSFVQRQEVIQECLIGLFVKERRREAGRERLGEEYVHIDGGAIYTCTCNESVKVLAHSGTLSGMHRFSAFLQYMYLLFLLP